MMKNLKEEQRTCKSNRNSRYHSSCIKNINIRKIQLNVEGNKGQNGNMRKNGSR